MDTSIRHDALPSTPPPPVVLAASEELAPGPQTTVTALNVWQTQTLSLDPWQGHDYMHARYYASAIGRFLSFDPVGGAAGSNQRFNRYSYVLGNPLSLLDPNGEDVIVAIRPVTPAPVCGHAYIVIEPSEANRSLISFAKKMRGQNRFVLSAGPEVGIINGRAREALVPFVNHPMDEMGDAIQLFKVPAPDGMSMEEFEQRILAAYTAYAESGLVPYDRDGADFHGKNSNAFASGLLAAAGADVDSLPPVVRLLTPGWGDPLEIDIKMPSKGDECLPRGMRVTPQHGSHRRRRRWRRSGGNRNRYAVPGPTIWRFRGCGDRTGTCRGGHGCSWKGRCTTCTTGSRVGRSCSGRATTRSVSWRSCEGSGTGTAGRCTRGA